VDFVNIGGASNGAQSITAAVNVTNPPSFTTLSVNDNGDGTARNITMDNNGTTATLTGIAPALISWPQADVTTVNLTAGSGLDTFNLPRTTEAVSYNGNGSHDIVNVGNTTNGVQSILNNLTFTNGPSFNVLNVNDAGDTTARTITHDTVVISASNFGRITGLGPFVMDYKYGDTEALNLTLGVGTTRSTSCATVRRSTSATGPMPETR
jgi:hypothetical protein